MEVKIMAATEKPIDVISLAAGTSYGKDNVSLKRVESCVKHGHTSIIEHAYITFRIDGISRACGNQLVRHRLASYVQESQRYCKYTDLMNEDWYVVPPSIKGDSTRERIFRMDMKHAAMSYLLLLESGVNAEDARYVLGNAAKTSITMSMNPREFFGFLNLRLSQKAQWEIRELAENMRWLAEHYNEQWAQLMQIYTDNQQLVN